MNSEPVCTQYNLLHSSLGGFAKLLQPGAYLGSIIQKLYQQGPTTVQMQITYTSSNLDSSISFSCCSAKRFSASSLVLQDIS